MRFFVRLSELSPLAAYSQIRTLQTVSIGEETIPCNFVDEVAMTTDENQRSLILVCTSQLQRSTVNRDLKQTTTATATRTPRNKRFNEKNNSCARAL